MSTTPEKGSRREDAVHDGRGWQWTVLLCGLLGACGGRTPLGKAAQASGTSGGNGTSPWMAPAADGSCPGGMSLCGQGSGARCHALDHDPMNCGRCDDACSAGIACAGGVCQQTACPASLSFSPLPVATPSPPNFPRYTTADVNGDGKLDLVAWSDSGNIEISLGNGNGTFSPASSYPAWESASSYVMDQFVVVGDFNEDGNPDLAVSVPGKSDAVDVWLGNGDGTLQTHARHGGQPLSQIVAGDVNRDGHLDVVINNVDSRTIVVLLGRGNGTFAKSATISMQDIPVEIVIRDWDGDGWPDLLAMGSNLSILLATGNGTFAKPQDCGISVDLRQTVIADFNGDGKLDVAAPLYPMFGVSVMLGAGGCAFAPRDDYPTPGLPVILVSGDLNGDGILDLAEWDVSDTSGHFLALLGKADGTFVPSAEWTGNRDAGDILIGDFNGDGRADVVVGDAAGAHVQLNTCP